MLKKTPVRERDIKHYHEFLPKQERPEQGHRYVLSMNDEATYVADIKDFNGGCWATVKVVQAANEKYEHLYAPDMEFDIKVAHYGFQEVVEETPTESEEKA